MLWEVDIYPGPGQPDRVAADILANAADLGLSAGLRVTAARAYLIEGRDLGRSEIDRLARQLLADGVVERTVIAPVGDEQLMEETLVHRLGARRLDPSHPEPNHPELSYKDGALSHGRGSGVTDRLHLVHVMLKPGVMDPVAESTVRAMADLGLRADRVCTLAKFWFGGITDEELQQLCAKALANDVIQQVIIGPLHLEHLELGSAYKFQKITVALSTLDDTELAALSQQGQLHLQLVEMKTIQAHFAQLGREPTDIELETIAQTWSEHCSHKTLTGPIEYRDERLEHRFENMLQETIFAATRQIRRELGESDWCVSVFEDNAGIVRFDDQYNLAFKVETHNHPSALEPYGGANTGLGGVIRDMLGTGLGAKPIANTDVFCFALPDMPPEEMPRGVLHPRRVMKGVVAGVRDYGNRMGIPTVNGAIYFDARYLGNPLVYCGSVGLIPRDKSHKGPQPGDLIVTVGGRTGRDGIHGATFSSTELTSRSETTSGGAVQIGNAITEKMMLDVLLTARDHNLYHAVTDCGAGGFSSAVGEMGATIGAEVWLDRVPLKYEGLSYTEIWISEAQERMVLAVPPERWDELRALCVSESVEAMVIGKYVPTGRLVLKYHEHVVGELSMQFLHKSRPSIVRRADYRPRPAEPLANISPNAANPPFPPFGRGGGGGWPQPMEIRAPSAHPAREDATLVEPSDQDYTDVLLAILGSLNVASKEWVIRQYDHEVQGSSVIKPLVGLAGDGPSDAAVLKPVLDSYRGIVIACGMNPCYGDWDTYHMAASAIDEAMRNCVAVGADPSRIAILDNFCWGNCDQPETLGALVRAALACHDLACAFGTPFISGKDSLNNEYAYEDATGEKRTMAIPPSLLISALGQIDDVRQAVTMDLKEPGNDLYQVGATKDELAGSHWALVRSLAGGHVPEVDVNIAKQTFLKLHQAMRHGLVRSCHDLSEGGLAVCVAEMAFAGGFGACVYLDHVPDALRSPKGDAVLLFSESNSRFLCEVTPAVAAEFEQVLSGVPFARIGHVISDTKLQVFGLTPAGEKPTIMGDGQRPLVIDAELSSLKEAWQAPLRW